MLVSSLMLDEQEIHADQVGEAGAAQRVEVQAGGEAQVVAVAVEPAFSAISETRVPR